MCLGAPWELLGASRLEGEWDPAPPRGEEDEDGSDLAALCLSSLSSLLFHLPSPGSLPLQGSTWIWGSPGYRQG